MAQPAGAIAGQRTHVALWFAVVVFAYYYKVLFCGFLGDVIGADCVCETSVRGISTNHWFEIIVYAPLLWLALHQVNADVFDDLALDPDDRRRRRLQRLVGEFAIALVIYGAGIHIANVIEIYSRVGQGIESGEVYRLIYFLDEDVSHYVQFVPLFFVIGWFIIHDRLPHPDHATLALLLGVGHGVERAVGIIEGSKWFLGPATVLWLGAAALVRARRFNGVAATVRDDFFFRYAVAFCLAFPVAQLAYLAEVGSFTSPSELRDSESVVIATGAMLLTLIGTAVLAASERWWNPHRGSVAGPTPND